MSELEVSDVPQHARRVVPLVWGASAVAALLLVLGVNGTLSSWTTAVVVNKDNQAGTIQAVVLTESGLDGTGAAVSCASSGNATNTYNCTQINKYGQAGVKQLNLGPGDTATSTVTFTNTGGLAASSFVLSSGSCVSAFQSPLTGTPASPNTLCQALTVGVACTGDATLTVAPVALSSFTGGSLNVGAGMAHGNSTTCVFTVALPSGASPLVAGQTATQDLTWTLST